MDPVLNRSSLMKEEITKEPALTVQKEHIDLVPLDLYFHFVLIDDIDFDDYDSFERRLYLMENRHRRTY